jgi:hypothetical protein
MPDRFNFNAQHVALTLLALMMSAVLGATIPMLQADSSGISTSNQRRVVSATPQLSAVTETALPATNPPAVAADLDAAGGVLLAWQEPDPATPTSTLVAFQAASLPAPVAGTPVALAPVAALRASVPALALPNASLPADPPDVAPALLISPTQAATALSARAAAASATPASPSSPAALAMRLPTGAIPAPVRRSATAAPTPTPTGMLVVAVPEPASPPALRYPSLDDRQRGEVQFEWLPAGALPRHAAYEVVVWSPEQDANQAWGAAPPTTMPSLRLNLDELFQSGRFPTGNLYWTVLVVDQNPYRRLTQPGESERRYLVYATGE